MKERSNPPESLAAQVTSTVVAPPRSIGPFITYLEAVESTLTTTSGHGAYYLKQR